MTSPEKKEELLVRGVAVSGSSLQWTLLGISEIAAAESVRSMQNASARLSAWTKATLSGADGVEVISVKKIESEPPAPAKKARQVNGVSKALSPEYCEMFSALAADFISVESALAAAASRK